MKPLLWLFALVCLLVSCHGSAGQPGADDGDNSPAAPVKLAIDAQELDGAWRVICTVRNAADLYQAAGTLNFPADCYQLVSIEAGGGLGGPQESYFVGKETAPGQVGFAYTKRYAGAGVNGDVTLLGLIVTPLNGKFALADFQLEQGSGKCVLRDSKKHALAIEGEVR